MMLVDESMTNYRFATKREINQGFQNKYYKGPMHKSRYTRPKHHYCTMKIITHV
jgi:hypothetical protein